MIEFTVDTEQSIIIPCEDVHLNGILHIPSKASGLVIFVHGSGSGRLSPRNQYVASVLQNSRHATLLFDLLTPEEDVIDNETREYRFNIHFLVERLLAATNWILSHPSLRKMSIGYFGASTGGGAALVAAAQAQKLVKAVVSRGGRPDLAGDALHKVEAPTLLIVGGNDEIVIELNEKAYNELHCIKKLDIVPGATHLFEEPGTLEKVAQLADAWFSKYLE